MNLHFEYGKVLSNFLSESDPTALKIFKAIINDPTTGFFNLTDNKEHLETSKKIHQKYKHKKHFIQIGIGGSALGPEMLIKALKKSDVHFTFINNVDADELFDQLQAIDPNKALFYVVSKSGGTAETLAGLQIASTWLMQNGVLKENLKDYIVFCTDPINGDLRLIANEQKFDCLEIPSNIGGRFSVLTPVGLFPALFAGIDIDKLYAGANQIKPQLLLDNAELNPLLKLSSLIWKCYQQGMNETVLMPYSSKLKELSSWFVQLWAESLGKLKSPNHGVGLTPIPAYGPTDQHSQVQLFMEGPHNKVIFLIGVENRAHDFNMDGTFSGKSFELLKPFTLNRLMKAELYGTLKALDEAKRAYVFWNWDKISEENIGAAILFFESLTAIVGKFYFQIDPFNQPGVEAGKKYAFEWLKFKD